MSIFSIRLHFRKFFECVERPQTKTVLLVVAILGTSLWAPNHWIPTNQITKEIVWMMGATVAWGIWFDF